MKKIAYRLFTDDPKTRLLMALSCKHSANGGKEMEKIIRNEFKAYFRLN